MHQFKTFTKVFAATGAFVLLMGAGLVTPAIASSNNGFDQFGYNVSARVFNGTGSSWCQGTIGWDKPTCDAYMAPYANDSLIMKWNAAWDACNAAGNSDPAACSGATLTNEWNGNVPNGSGDTEHFKTVWSQSCTNGVALTDGGTCIWNNYEVLMDQGMVSGAHTWWTHAVSTGFGVGR